MKDEKRLGDKGGGYREDGVFQRLHLCEYLRELASDGQEAGETGKDEASRSTADPRRP